MIMLNYGKIVCFCSVIVLLVWNFSCASASMKEQSIVNVEKEKTKEVPPKVTYTPSKIRKPWQVGIYRGLIMGTSSLDDLKRILGEPSAIADLKSVGIPDEWAYHYDLQEDIKGNIVVYINKSTKTVISIEINPDSMTKEEVLNYFGDGYVNTTYSFDYCLYPNSDSAPMYEDPNGEDNFIEYRDKGVAILLYDTKDKYYDTVQYIEYLSEPLGSPVSKCTTDSKKK